MEEIDGHFSTDEEEVGAEEVLVAAVIDESVLD